MPLRTPRRIGTLRSAAAAALLALGATLIAPGAMAAHAADPTTDYCAGQCSDILPPGENGNATFADILANKALGTRPDHTMDQLGPYSSLADGYQNLTDSTLGNFFNSSSFGVPAGQVASVISPRSDVTITRDKATGVPHIKGTTRDGTEFGAGYAAAQDRLWLMDLFRHVGRGELSSFAGGAAANRGLEQEFWRQAPYTEADLQAQIDWLSNNGGAAGKQALADAQAYIDGINSYITAAKDGRYFPGEYDLTGHMDPITNAGTIEPFQLTDLIALASVVGALFGTGGGGEVQSALSLLASQQKYGVQQGTDVWESFRERDDPEATSTVHDGTSFPYAGKPANPQGEALPDPGSVVPEPLVYDATGGATQATTKSPGVLPSNLFSNPRKGMSNALVVSGAHTASGHPVAVFGPQTGYFAPQLLMLQELQGPGISARGASFAGLGMYVELGRGQDYAWSATSASQDVTDTYAVQLCQDDSHYMLHGSCVPMEKLERTNSWSPTLADSTAAGSYRMQVWRTAYGPVEYRATVGGKPVAYTQLRSSYMHEADSIIGFEELNDPGFVHDAASFQKAAQDINYTFNWFYADSRQTAYYNSGTNPVRADGVDASFPVWGDRAVRLAGLGPDPQHRRLHPARTASAVHRPGLLRQLEQQAGPRVHLGGLRQRLGAPRRPAQRPGQGAGPGRRRDPGRARQGDGGRRRDRPAGGGRAARPAPGDQQRARHRSPGGRRGPAVDRLGHGGHQTHGDVGRFAHVRRRGRGTDHGRVVAAADPGRVRARARQRPLHRADRRPDHRRVAVRRTRPDRVARGQLLPVRLVVVRRQGPAQGARAVGEGTAGADVLRRRAALRLPGHAAVDPEAGGRHPGGHRLPG